MVLPWIRAGPTETNSLSCRARRFAVTTHGDRTQTRDDDTGTRRARSLAIRPQRPNVACQRAERRARVAILRLQRPRNSHALKRIAWRPSGTFTGQRQRRQLDDDHSTPVPIAIRKTLALAQPFRIVLATPSDVDLECAAVVRVVDELNRAIARYIGAEVKLSHWKTDTAPGFDPRGPQGLIDDRLKINGADAFVGVFWTRFGTPTGDAQSGTEHEFWCAYNSWKTSGRPRIMMYFSKVPAAPRGPDDTAQWTRVLEFKRDFPREGLFWEYDSREEFENVVRVHLTQVLLEAIDVVGPRRKALRGIFDTLSDSRDLRFVYSSTRVEGFENYQRRKIVYPFSASEKRVTAIPDAQGIAILHRLLEIVGKRERIHVITADDFTDAYWTDDVILVGSQNANPPSQTALERAGVPFRFTGDVDGVIDLRHGESARWPLEGENLASTDYALLVKLRSESSGDASTHILTGGIGGIGTLAACYYLQRNAADLFSAYGSRPFACVLRIPEKDQFTGVEIVAETELPVSGGLPAATVARDQ